MHAAVQIQGLWEFLVHLAMVELLGAQPLCMMLTLYSLAAQTFSQSSSSPKGEVQLACVPLDRALEAEAQNHLSLQSVPTGYTTKHHILESHYQSSLCPLLYFLILFVFFTRDAPDGQQTWSYLGIHLTMTTALCWQCSHEHYTNITENHQPLFILILSTI